MRYFYFLISFVFLSLSSTAQHNKDSLWKVWGDNHLPDSVRIDAIDYLAWNVYLYSHPDSSFYAAQLFYDFAESLDNKSSMAKALSIQASSYYIQNNYLQAIDYYEKSLAIYHSINSKKGIAGTYNNLGISYETLSNYDKALNYYNKSLEIKQEINDSIGLAFTLGNIGIVYSDLGEIEKSISYFEKSLNIYKKFNDKQGIAISLENIGEVYANSGDLEKAQDNFQQSLDIYLEIEDELGRGFTLKSIGIIYFDLGNYDLALEYQNQALSLFKNFNDENSMAHCYLTIGKIHFEKSDYKKAEAFFNTGLSILNEVGNEKIKTELLNEMAKIYRSKGLYSKALKSYYEALEISEKYNDIKGIALTNINLGNIYADQFEYQKAIELFNLAHESYKKVDHKKGIAKAKSCLGGVHKSNKEFNKAITHYQACLEIQEGIKNLDGIATSLGNLGELYIEFNQLDLAMDYFKKSLELEEKRGNQKCIAICKKNMANVYQLKGSYLNSIKLSNQALEISSKIEVPWVIRDAAKSLYLSYKSINKISEALEMHELYIKNRDIVNKENDKKELFRYQFKYAYEKQADSLKIEQKRKNDIAQKDVDIAKKEAENKNIIIITAIIILILIIVLTLIVSNRLRITRKQKKVIEKQREVTLEKNKELERLSIVVRETENIILILDSAGNLEWVNDSFVKLNNLTLEEVIAERGEHITTISNNTNVKQILETCRTTKTPYRYDSLNITNQGWRVWESSTITPIFDAQGVIQNFIIIDTDITKQKDTEELVNQKNKDITDSINYAKRLQNAILTSLETVNNVFPESFIYNNPKDIVSGDFYWLETIKNKIFFAVADSTGHGVPGALVSVVCSNVLTRSLIEERITQPGKILNRARDLVINRFAKSKDDIRDGMDISLCSLDINSGELEWAGANNPLWIIRKNSNEIEEIIPDKQPIGMYATENLFTNHKIKVDKGDQLYLFTDGFSDQFGGKSSKKYKSSNFKTFLLSIRNHNMDKQHALLSKEFDSWKGDLEQIDDVCVMGVRV